MEGIDQGVRAGIRRPLQAFRVHIRRDHGRGARYGRHLRTQQPGGPHAAYENGAALHLGPFHALQYRRHQAGDSAFFVTDVLRQLYDLVRRHASIFRKAAVGMTGNDPVALAERIHALSMRTHKPAMRTHQTAGGLDDAREAPADGPVGAVGG